jgi:hypothetical protein
MPQYSISTFIRLHLSNFPNTRTPAKAAYRTNSFVREHRLGYRCFNPILSLMRARLSLMTRNIQTIDKKMAVWWAIQKLPHSRQAAAPFTTGSRRVT